MVTDRRGDGGAWGFPKAGQFFTVGLEGDRLRIFELATAIAKLPL